MSDVSGAEAEDCLLSDAAVNVVDVDATDSDGDVSMATMADEEVTAVAVAVAAHEGGGWESISTSRSPPATGCSSSTFIAGSRRQLWGKRGA